MKILVAGAGGFIGRRLVERLLALNHQVYALVRDATKAPPKSIPIVGDLLNAPPFPPDCEAAYYLVHSMTQRERDFATTESRCAQQFMDRLTQTSARQIIYLSGLATGTLSPHFASRLRVETILRSTSIPATILRASIIIGKGSASFQIIRDLVERLPVMIAPRWTDNRTQPIAITNVIDYLTEILGKGLGATFEIGGPEILTYRELLLRYAHIRGLHRLIIKIPLLTPRISAYWLVFVTSANYSLARRLIESLRNDSICHDHSIQSLIPLDLIPLNEALRTAI
jgi:uncharacterized protein YbjT (DUF2867 family)